MDAEIYASKRTNKYMLITPENQRAQRVPTLYSALSTGSLV
jgi:hypothetical protein